LSIRLFLIFAFVIVFGFIHVFVTSDSLATNKRLPDITPLNFPKIEITSHRNGDYVYPSSELTIKGTSSDTGKTNCTIYTSINNIQPFQNASAAGPQGKNDFSIWDSTFFNATDLIKLGKNEITSFIVCFDANNNTPTSSFQIINLTGVFNDSSSLSSGSDSSSRSNSSFVSNEIHDNIEKRINAEEEEQHKGTERSRMDLQNAQNTPYRKSISPNGDQNWRQTQSTVSPNGDQNWRQTQSTVSPNGGQSTIEHP
jgi:hypothetical protein